MPVRHTLPPTAIGIGGSTDKKREGQPRNGVPRALSLLLFLALLVLPLLCPPVLDLVLFHVISSAFRPRGRAIRIETCVGKFREHDPSTFAVAEL